MLPINPYISNVKFTLCGTPEQQEQSQLLVVELMTNEVAAAEIEAFSIEYYNDGGKESGCGDLLGLFVELIDRGGGYLKILKHVKCASCYTTRSPRF